MKVLALETSTLTGSVALLVDEKLIGEITLSVSVQHSERLMPAIEDLLKNAGAALSEIDLIGVSVGPGSFTGLRIGIAAAQGLAMAAGKPLVGVSTLEALAFQGIFFNGFIVPVLNAYRGEVYRGIYRGLEGEPKEVEPDGVLGVDSLIRELQERGEKVLLLGDGVEAYREQFQRVSADHLIRIAPQLMRHPKASHTALLAWRRWEKGERDAVVSPRYLRAPG